MRALLLMLCGINCSLGLLLPFTKRNDRSYASFSSQASNNDKDDDKSLELPLLPPTIDERDTREIKTLVVDGAPIMLDELGPIVVSRDGQLSSIKNWHELSEGEQAFAMRKIGKRNQERLAALRDKNAGEAP